MPYASGGGATKIKQPAQEQARVSVFSTTTLVAMALTHPTFPPLPMPIRTPRLLLRPKQPGDGKETALAIEETWADLHAWMRWAEDRASLSAEAMEARNQMVMEDFHWRKQIELIGIETGTKRAVVWCGLSGMDWEKRRCSVGYWVRKSAQNRGIATEAANAMVRYAFEVLELRRVELNHAAGNAASGRVAEKLGFQFEGIQKAVELLAGGRRADKYCYARYNMAGLASLDVHWG